MRIHRLLVHQTSQQRNGVLSQDACEIIWNVYHFHKNMNQVNVPDIVVNATEVSKSIVVRIIRGEGNAIQSGEIESSKVSNKRMKSHQTHWSMIVGNK
ncbi:hypothetical protein FQA39_LY05476 [Lamprigera yunnana]|nr:hypothetical protein FQA39_LY05476 [Lamprigera yunnana]